MFIQSYAFKNKGFGFYIGELCIHMLINAPTPSSLLLKLSRVLSRAQLQPLHKTPQRGGVRQHVPPHPGRRLRSEAAAFTGVAQDSVYRHRPNTADPHGSALLTASSEEALTHLKNLFLILQGNVLHLNPYGFGAPVPRQGLSSVFLVPARGRGHRSALGRRSLWTLWRDLTVSTQRTHGPSKGGDKRDHG